MSVQSLPWGLSDWITESKISGSFVGRFIDMICYLFVTYWRDYLSTLLWCYYYKWNLIDRNFAYYGLHVYLLKRNLSICSWFVATDDNNELGLKLEITKILHALPSKITRKQLIMEGSYGLLIRWLVLPYRIQLFDTFLITIQDYFVYE